MTDRTFARNLGIALAGGAAVIAAGLIVYAVSSGFDRTAAEPDVEAMREQARNHVEQMQETLLRQIDERQLAEEKARMESETGLALSALCAQWTELHSNHPDVASRQHRDEACRRYNDYLRTGIEPE